MPLKKDAVNQIMPFAPDALEADGDLLSLAEYEQDVMRRRGFRSGLARRAIFNRAHRQTAHMAAGLAQYIANRHAPGVLDNANLDQVEEGLQAALESGLVPHARKLNTTAPLTGGGDLSTDRTLGISDGTESAKGAVQLATTAETTAGTLKTKGVHPAGLKAALDAAVPDLSGYAAKARKISTSAPLTGGGDLTADRTLGISDATESAKGATQLATTAETTAGTLKTKGVHPAGLKAALESYAAVKHAATHAAGGADAVTPAAIGALALTGGTLTGDLTVQKHFGVQGNIYLGDYATPSYLYMRAAKGPAATVSPGQVAPLRVYHMDDSANADVTILLGSNGLTIVGAGEFIGNFYNAYVKTADGRLLSDSSENLILGADSEIWLVSGANTIANRKIIKVNTAGHMFPENDGEGYIGIAAKHFAGAYIDNGYFTSVLKRAGSNVVTIDEFTQSLGTNGWQRLPSGLIIQWGQFTTAVSSDATLTFPIAFTSACYSFTALPDINSGGYSEPSNQYRPCGYMSLSKTGVKVRTSVNGDSEPIGQRRESIVSWIAIGR